MKLSDRNKILTQFRIISISFILLTFGCNINWYGDIDLGGDYYYLVEPAFNSIDVPVNTNAPYASSNYVIENVEEVGFDKQNILVISKLNGETTYWWIDKTKESKKLGFGENSILKMSNTHQIDSTRFQDILTKTGIELKTKTYYRKKLNYE